MKRIELIAPALAVFLAAACAGTSLPAKSPPLLGMDEPPEYMQEPDDEAKRQELPRGSFTGIVAGDARDSLDALLAAPEGVLVARVVENSPAAIAGLVEGDLLLEARVGGESTTLAWPAEWRRLELETEPGTRVALIADRAGAELEFELETVPRVATPARASSERFREEQRVGVVVRTATEVEARAAALGPGGGAVLVGMTRESPWRGAGVVYGDLIRAAGGVEIHHPQVLLDQIRAAPPKSKIELEIVRAGELLAIDAPLSRRVGELKSLSLQPLYSYSRDRDLTSHSIVLGLIRWRRTPAAWDLRLLWWFSIRGGDADRLEAVR